MTLSPYHVHEEVRETAVTVTPPNIKFEPATSREKMHNAHAHGMQCLCLFTVANILPLEPVTAFKLALNGTGVEIALFDKAEVEANHVQFRYTMHYR